MEAKLGEFPLVKTNPILCSGWERVHPVVASRSSARGWMTPEELGAAISAGAESSPMAQGKEGKLCCPQHLLLNPVPKAELFSMR